MLKPVKLSMNRNSERCRCLDRTLENYPHECRRLARLKDAAGKDPDDIKLKTRINSLEIRIQELSEAFRILNYDEMRLLYLHYECGMSYEYMERFFHYSRRTIHYHIQRILKKIMKAYPEII